MLTTAPFIDFEEPENLDQEPEPPPRTEEERRAWYREGIESWREFERTGLHLTSDEVDAWLDTWGTEPPTDPPKCHT